MLVFQNYLVFLVVLLSHKVNALKATDIFASLGEMVNLVNTGVKVTQVLTDYIAEEEKRLNEAKKIVEDFSLINEMSVENPERFVGNPVNAFLIIKQLTKNLQKFIDTLNNFEHLKRIVHDIQESHDLPSSDDYIGTIKAIHRLEDTYKLDAKSIRNGNLSEAHPTLRKLTAFECFEMGRVAYENSDYYHCIIWMMEAIEVLQEEVKGTGTATVELVEILDYLAFSTAQKGNIQHAIELTEQMLKIDPSHERGKSNLVYYKKLRKERMKQMLGDVDMTNMMDVKDPTTFENNREIDTHSPEEQENYERLCRGSHIENVDRRLKCRYVRDHPFLVIGPIKEEQVHIEPDIWVFYDVVSDKQIKAMKSLATPILKRAIVRNPKSGEYETAEYRVSKSAWLNDGDNPMFPYLTKLVEAATKLSLESAEEWQIANYGIGGQYDPHFDFARKSEAGHAFPDSIGNRIATWMFYLEAPEEGGATVFPFLNIRVQPIKGSAVFWYNLLPSGDGDYKTRHAACPVLYGQKWVSNKWLHSAGQEFKRPCHLNRQVGV